MRKVGILGRLRPDAFSESVYDIDLGLLAQRGFRALLIDIDNTLIEWNGTIIPGRLRQWFASLSEKGFLCCIVSNNKHHRVAEFCQELKVPFIAMAGKPGKRAYAKALALLNVKPSEAAVIGDQIFTDILGGNRAGLYTILVVPVSKTELWSTRQVRRVERWILRQLKREDGIGTSASQSR